MTGRDLYGEADGPRRSAKDREDAIAQARAINPAIYVEGSTGNMITFWVRVGDGKDCVGSAWERRNGQWYWRLRP
jgi:hypothetical protein